MFTVAFVAGLAVQFGFNEAGRHSVEFTEGWGISCPSSSAPSWPAALDTNLNFDEQIT